MTKTFCVIGMGLALGITGCSGEEDAAKVSWVEAPVTAIEADLNISGSWSIETSFDVQAVGIVACQGVVEDCGKTGQADATGPAILDEATGTYTAEVNLPVVGEWTVVAYALVEGSAWVSPGHAVLVDPAPAKYVEGPFGTRTGDAIKNLEWTGYKDTAADEDDDPFNEAPRTVALENYFRGKRGDPNATLILLNSSAGWCGACKYEAVEIKILVQEFGPQGVHFITTLFQDASGGPTDAQDALNWGVTYGKKTPVVADPSDLVGPYYVENSTPLNMIIRADTMEIVEQFHGYDTAYLRGLLQRHVNLD